MSQCTDVDAALKRLEKKVDDQNKEIARLKALQQQCCANNNNNSDSSLAKRVAAIERYINALDKDIKKITGITNELGTSLSLMFANIDKLMEKVISVFGVFSNILRIFK